jgi:hypothetical protein
MSSSNLTDLDASVAHSAFKPFAVPAAIFDLLAQELIGQCVGRFFESKRMAGS